MQPFIVRRTCSDLLINFWDILAIKYLSKTQIKKNNNNINKKQNKKQQQTNKKQNKQTNKFISSCGVISLSLKWIYSLKNRHWIRYKQLFPASHSFAVALTTNKQKTKETNQQIHIQLWGYFIITEMDLLT